MEEKWKVYKSGDKWEVWKISDDTPAKKEKKVSTHDSEDSANQKMKALYANVKDASTKEIDQDRTARIRLREAIAQMSEFYMDNYEYVRTYGATSFGDLIAAEEAEERGREVRKRAAQLTEMVFDITWNPEITDKTGAFKSLFDEFLEIAKGLFDEPMSENVRFESSFPVEISDIEEMKLSEMNNGSSEGLGLEDLKAHLTENELSVISKIMEDVKSGKLDANRAPLFANVVFIEPGWGNTADNHYYPPETLTEYGDVFRGAKMYETDHDETKRSTGTWVSTSLGLVGFSETGGPMHRVFIHDPDFAEKMRNLNRGEILDKMECSILAGGMVERKKFRDEAGREGRRVVSIENVHAVDWVTRAGAGGRTVNLIENQEIGGIHMEKKDKKEKDLLEAEEITDANVSESEDKEVIPVTIHESDDSDTPGNGDEVEYLEEAEISALLETTHLPEPTKKRLGKGQYESLTELQEAITEAVEEVKAISGSGMVFGLGPTEGAEEDQYQELKPEQFSEALDEVDRKVGLLPAVGNEG